MILVVDDDRDTRESFAELFRLEGYSVAVAADGAEALKIVQTQPEISLVFLDVGMPGMSGFAVAKALEVYGVPVVMLTGYTKLSRPVNAVEILIKPCSFNDVFRLARIYDAGSVQARVVGA
jgi:CheY-like chemotaxis protein